MCVCVLGLTRHGFLFFEFETRNVFFFEATKSFENEEKFLENEGRKRVRCVLRFNVTARLLFLNELAERIVFFKGVKNLGNCTVFATRKEEKKGRKRGCMDFGK